MSLNLVWKVLRKDLALGPRSPLFLWMKTSTVFDPGTSLTQGARRIAAILPTAARRSVLTRTRSRS